MVVHLFGAVSSPSCCNLALQRIAIEKQEEFSLASNAILRHFYVDDFLKSEATEAEAISMIKDVTEVCQLGGFHITKWVSSSKNVLESIPEDDRAKGLRKLTFDDSPTERALGVYWDIVSDSFGFSITDKSSGLTRRDMLSTVCSLYDPLGFGSPVILVAKILLQELCLQNVGWDDEFPQSVLLSWQQWLSNVYKLENLRVSRCLLPADFGEVACTQLHYFSDASEKGYGIISYIRFTNTRGQVHCQLLISKARVAPIKKVSIPRLELTAATIAVKLHRRLQDELDIKVDAVLFWTDSLF